MNHRKFTMEETRQWGLTEMEALIGKYVSVEVPASEHIKRMLPDLEYEGGSGMVVHAMHSALEDSCTVMWDDGMGIQWRNEDGAYVSVCENIDHGNHLDILNPEIVECIRALRFAPKEEEASD